MPVERVSAADVESVRTAICNACGMPFAVDRRGTWAGCFAMVRTIGRFRGGNVVLYFHPHCWARRHPALSPTDKIRRKS